MSTSISKIQTEEVQAIWAGSSASCTGVFVCCLSCKKMGRDQNLMQVSEEVQDDS